MCNLYEHHLAEQEKIFGKGLDEVLGNLPPQEVYPGGQGIVYNALGELRVMTWGFPLALKSKQTGQLLKPKPVNNARTDKLDSFMWRDSFDKRRCLIPATRFAEAEGAKGSMTRTWFSPTDQPRLFLAGVWRESIEWGGVYSMVMTESAAPVSRIHDRMPVVLTADEQSVWLLGSPAEAFSLCRPKANLLLEDRTAQLWFKRKA